MKVSSYLSFFKPLNLLASILMFTLGVGLARYQASGVYWTIFGLGLVWVLIVQLGGQFIYEYVHAAPQNFKRNTSGSSALSPNKILFAGLACFAVAASIMITLAVEYNRLFHPRPDPLVYLLIISLFFGVGIYSIPPFKIEYSGYGELFLSILLGFVIPSLAFSMQSAALNKLVPMVTFPIVLLILAMLIAFELPGYFSDFKHGRQNLMVRMGWEKAISLHKYVILMAYLLVGIAAFVGLPRFAALAAWITIPIGLLQIFQMRRIEQGKPPNWRALKINAAASFASMAYLSCLAFWTH